MIKDGDLKVSWDNRNLDIESRDSVVKNEIVTVFKKMPLWTNDYPHWEDISGKDTIFVDYTKREFYRFLLPDDPFLFNFKLTDSLTYQYEGKSFLDTIQVTGGRLGFPKHEKIYPIDDICATANWAIDASKTIKREVDKRFSLRKTYKLLKLKEIDIIISASPELVINIESRTKRAKRLGRKIEKLLRNNWRKWNLFRGQFIVRVRLKPDLGVWVYF